MCLLDIYDIPVLHYSFTARKFKRSTSTGTIKELMLVTQKSTEIEMVTYKEHNMSKA